MNADEKRELFGDGPWMSEPDRLEWTTPAGLPGLIVRHSELGHLCGYVGLPPGHRLHGADASDADRDLDVHGGVNYARACDGDVCHVPAPGEPEDVWWLGFDCGHLGDRSPGVDQSLMRFGCALFRPATYRTIAYVRDEVERLAQQLAEEA